MQSRTRATRLLYQQDGVINDRVIKTNAVRNLRPYIQMNQPQHIEVIVLLTCEETLTLEIHRLGVCRQE
jgi:hypothetical protein